MLAALERITLNATRALSVVGLIALMGLATMTLADGLLRWLANRPIEGVRDLGGLAIAVAIACCIPVVLVERGNIAIRLGGTLHPLLGKVLDAIAAVAVCAVLAVAADAHHRLGRSASSTFLGSFAVARHGRFPVGQRVSRCGV